MGKKALVIGAGGVSNVVCHKCAQNSEVFSSIMIASRTKAKCDEIGHTPEPHDYQGYFSKLSQHEGCDGYVTDPNNSWIFRADGTVVKQ